MIPPSHVIALRYQPCTQPQLRHTLTLILHTNHNRGGPFRVLTAHDLAVLKIALLKIAVPKISLLSVAVLIIAVLKIGPRRIEERKVCPANVRGS